MAYARRTPYLHATWIPRYLTGDKLCLWACWFKANFQGYDKMPSDFDVARWTMEHTDLLNKLIADLEEQGCKLFIEHQNGFRVVSSRTGAVIGGRAVVYDVKTGQESASHIVQVQIYMYLLPRSELVEWQGRKLEGAVVYKDGRQVDIPADSIGDTFVARLADFMQKMTSPLSPRRVPSKPECGFCELTSADCPDRIVSEPVAS